MLAMFASNVTPAIIVAGAAGIRLGVDQGAPNFPGMTYMIQMSMPFVSIATLFQTIGFGLAVAQLPIVQGTSMAGVNMLSGMKWNRCNMLIFAVSLGLGLQLVPEALKHLPRPLGILLTSGLLPAAALSIVFNPVLPQVVQGARANLR